MKITTYTMGRAGWEPENEATADEIRAANAEDVEVLDALGRLERGETTQEFVGFSMLVASPANQAELEKVVAACDADQSRDERVGSMVVRAAREKMTKTRRPLLRFVCLACHAVVYRASVPGRCGCGGSEFGAPAATLRDAGGGPTRKATS